MFFFCLFISNSQHLYICIFLPIFVLFLSVFVPRLPAPSPSRVIPGFGFNFPLSAGPSGLLTRWHSLQPCVQKGGRLGLIQQLCHCPPEQTETWGKWRAGERERGGGETGRETMNQLVREGWQSDSQCTITLVFRFGPSEHSFWTHLCLKVSSYSFFFLLFFLHGAPSNGNTFLSCLTAVPCLDFSLQTALHAWAGAGQSTNQGEAGDLSPPQPPGEWWRNWVYHNVKSHINFIHPQVLSEREKKNQL